ncbi:hypothetical protein TNIN_99701 [Trichonephila inaurata madagascariensis]|uniref:Uncharacterized protein n=1 Tax=Trichonephila inaurata madagascariensis TaxID=2747483 RepID=A0A8X6I6H8_9ARAC|nr:hypothetical protein TNIN_99701 [Trichonephila inaurata madagascariensis]
MDLLFYTLILYSNKNKTKTLGNYRTFLIPPLLFPRKPPPLKFQISKEIESISSNKSYYRKQHNCPEAKALVPEYRGVGHERSPSLGPKPVISPCHAKPEGGGARRDAEQRAIDTVRLLKVVNAGYCPDHPCPGGQYCVRVMGTHNCVKAAKQGEKIKLFRMKAIDGDSVR